MSIIQPRLENIGTCEITADELIAWGESIKETAKMAYEGKGEQKAGDWCRFCRARPVCKACRDEALSMSINRLSGGVKTLIQIAHDSDHVYNASACGDNCAAWLLRISKDKDVLVRLGHLMHFDGDAVQIRIENTGEIVESGHELVKKVIDEGFLDA